jgi:hypothetical protein
MRFSTAGLESRVVKAGKALSKNGTLLEINAGTLCFSRRIYGDQIARLACIEFGVLKLGGELWIKCFDNRPNLEKETVDE